MDNETKVFLFITDRIHPLCVATKPRTPTWKAGDGDLGEKRRHKDKPDKKIMEEEQD